MLLRIIFLISLVSSAYAVEYQIENYQVKEDDTLSNLIFDKIKGKKAYRLYGNDGLLKVNQKLNPNIQKWTQLKSGQVIKLQLPKDRADRALPASKAPNHSISKRLTPHSKKLRMKINQSLGYRGSNKRVLEHIGETKTKTTASAPTGVSYNLTGHSNYLPSEIQFQLGGFLAQIQDYDKYDLQDESKIYLGASYFDKEESLAYDLKLEYYQFSYLSSEQDTISVINNQDIWFGVGIQNIGTLLSKKVTSRFGSLFLLSHNSDSTNTKEKSNAYGFEFSIKYDFFKNLYMSSGIRNQIHPGDSSMTFFEYSGEIGFYL